MVSVTRLITQTNPPQNTLSQSPAERGTGCVNPGIADIIVESGAISIDREIEAGHVVTDTELVVDPASDPHCQAVEAVEGVKPVRFELSEQRKGGEIAGLIEVAAVRGEGKEGILTRVEIKLCTTEIIVIGKLAAQINEELCHALHWPEHHYPQ
jgi:hypothetical protein